MAWIWQAVTGGIERMYLALLGLAAMGLLGTLFAGSSDGDAGEDDLTPEPDTPEEPD